MIINRQLTFFCIGGTVTNMLCFLIFAGLIGLNLHYILASTVAFLCGIGFSFMINRALVFKSTHKLLSNELFIYLFFYVGLWLFSLLFLCLLKNTLGNIYIAQLINIVACAGIAYCGVKKLFRR